MVTDAIMRRPNTTSLTTAFYLLVHDYTVHFVATLFQMVIDNVYINPNFFHHFKIIQFLQAMMRKKNANLTRVLFALNSCCSSALPNFISTLSQRIIGYTFNHPKSVLYFKIFALYFNH